MAEKYVYLFGDGKADGRADMKNLLGGKGANLAEMSNLGIPVPAGFHHHHRNVHRLLQDEPQVSAASLDQVISAPPWPISKRSWARNSATQTIRCWFPCVPAPGCPCPA